MLAAIFTYLEQVDTFFWGYIAFVLITVLGLALTFQARFFQIRAFTSIFKTFFILLKMPAEQKRGVHPLKVFFASAGGMIGIGNVVGIVTAVQIGGPGALLWVWIAAGIGSIIKYSEIFLGLKYREKNKEGGFDGGPMFFLKKAFKGPLIPSIIAVLLCIYGVEIYQFSVVTDSLSTNFGVNRYIVIGILLPLVFYASSGGVPRIAKICSIIMPIFMLVYISMSLWIVLGEINLIPSILKDVFISAFTGHAAVGGFAGSTALLAIQHGVSRAAYSSDIGIGYDSIIQSESSTVHPERQARLAILGVFMDNLICTMSILVVLVSGVWKAVAVEGSLLIQTALSVHFPYMNLFMPIFLFIVGYSTIIAYFCVGLKCARFLFPKKGTIIYSIYGTASLVFFSFFDQSKALLVMSLAGSCLLIINLIGIFTLRRHLSFKEEETAEVTL